VGKYWAVSHDVNTVSQKIDVQLSEGKLQQAKICTSLQFAQGWKSENIVCKEKI
jgi:hypothetical protein